MRGGHSNKGGLDGNGRLDFANHCRGANTIRKMKAMQTTPRARKSPKTAANAMMRPKAAMPKKIQ